MDLAHKKTDKLLAKLERRLQLEYSKQFVGIKRQLAEMLGEIQGKDLTPLERYNLAIKYNRLNKLQDSITDTLQNATLEGVKDVNSTLVDIYKENYNEMARTAIVLFSVTKPEIKAPKKVGQEIQETQSPLNKMALDNVKGKTLLSQQIGRQITQGTMNGDDIDELINKIRKVTEAKLSDIVRIARTQTTRVENLARQDVLDNYEAPDGYEKTKTWRTVVDGNEREAHLKANNQEVLYNQYFDVGGEKLYYPADPNGSAGNVINCRCSMELGIRKVKK